MRRLHRAFDSLERVTDVLGWAIIYGMLALIGFTFVTVVMRYLFNRPSELSEELGGYLLAFVVFLGLAQALKAGTHVRSEVLVRYLPDHIRRKLQLLVLIVGVVFATMLAYSMWRMAIKDYIAGVKSFYILATPMWIPESIVAIGATVFLLQMIIQLVRVEIK